MDNVVGVEQVKSVVLEGYGGYDKIKVSTTICNILVLFYFFQYPWILDWWYDIVIVNKLKKINK